MIKKLFLLLTVFVLTFSIGYSVTYYETFNEAEQKELAEMLNKQKGNIEIRATWECDSIEKWNDFDVLCMIWAEINHYSVMDYHKIGKKSIIIMYKKGYEGFY